MHIALVGYFVPAPDRPRPTVEALQASVEARPAQAPGGVGLGLAALGAQAAAASRLAAGALAGVRDPAGAAGEIRDALGRATAAVRDDVLFPAPPSFLNGPIGPARRLVRCPL